MLLTIMSVTLMLVEREGDRVASERTNPRLGLARGSRPHAAGLLAYSAGVTDLPTGLYEEVITQGMHARLAPTAAAGLVQREELEPDDAPEILARYIGALARRALRAQSRSGDEASRLAAQITTANQVVTAATSSWTRSPGRRSWTVCGEISG